MGLRGYPGMMGPKGEAVSKDPCMFLFSNSFPFFVMLSPVFLDTQLFSFLDEHQGVTAWPAPTIQISSITSNGDIWK